MTATNPLGAVVVFDGENPRTITGKAKEDISAGEIIVCSGAFDVVGSQVASYSADDIVVCKSVSAAQTNGMAITTATSGNYLTFLTRGACLVKALGSVLQGTLVEAVAEAGVQSITSGAVPSALYAGVPGATAIGRAVTAAGSPNYALVDFHF